MFIFYFFYTTPKEFLWTDLESMDEFFRLDPVNEYFFECFTSLREGANSVTLDAVKVFNEVYYQATRIKYESQNDFNIDAYIQDIKANLGWSYSAELVMSMVYWMSEATALDAQPVGISSKRSIERECNNTNFWIPFRDCYQRIKEKNLQLKYDFAPKPVSTDNLRKKYIDWPVLTQNYDLKRIKNILNLWDNEKDKAKVAAMINDSLGRGAVVKKNRGEDGELIRLLDSYIQPELCFTNAESSPTEECNIQDEQISKLKDENQALQNKINELEAEIERLKALLEKKKINGKARRFTLVEIVDYCKSRVEWNDAKEIVAMLNRLLRKIGTKEDSKLVDSIEKEFKQRRYGNTFYAPVGQVVQHADNIETTKQ